MLYIQSSTAVVVGGGSKGNMQQGNDGVLEVRFAEYQSAQNAVYQRGKHLLHKMQYSEMTEYFYPEKNTVLKR